MNDRVRRLEANKHKPYRCAGCLGEGQVWDNGTENMDICYRCWGDGRVDSPVDPIRTRRLLGSPRRRLW